MRIAVGAGKSSVASPGHGGTFPQLLHHLHQEVLALSLINHELKRLSCHFLTVKLAPESPRALKLTPMYILMNVLSSLQITYREIMVVPLLDQPIFNL